MSSPQIRTGLGDTLGKEKRIEGVLWGFREEIIRLRLGLLDTCSQKNQTHQITL